MARLILFHKPYLVLSQFTDRSLSAVTTRKTLSDYIPIPDIYPAGRLDRDSEGLLLLTDDGKLQARISDPKYKWPKTYWVQVENIPSPRALEKLRRGILLKDGTTRPAKADLMPEPEDLWPRTPPIRVRKTVPEAWLCLTLKEGRNRQVRRMTAAIGHPTLRLIRYSIGPYSLESLLPGEYRQIKV